MYFCLAHGMHWLCWVMQKHLWMLEKEGSFGKNCSACSRMGSIFTMGCQCSASDIVIACRHWKNLPTSMSTVLMVGVQNLGKFIIILVSPLSNVHFRFKVVWCSIVEFTLAPRIAINCMIIQKWIALTLSAINVPMGMNGPGSVTTAFRLDVQNVNGPSNVQKRNGNVNTLFNKSGMQTSWRIQKPWPY